jgi:very-short-patch-repair endonuclease
VDRTGNATRLRRKQTREEAQLWQTLRAGRFAGFKFRRQHPLGGYFLDFYCPAARLAIELDGFEHGLPRQREHDAARDQFLAGEDIEDLRFWNHQWRSNREGVLWEIWHALQRRTGCLQVMRTEGNNRFVPPPVEKLGKKPDRKPPRDLQI